MRPRIRQVPGLHLCFDAELGASAGWRTTRSSGVAYLPLSDEGGDATVLIRMLPGSSYPAHRHVGIESVLVLAGGYQDEWGRHTAGTWLEYPAGSVHHPVALGDPSQAPGADNPACTLYAVARGGVENVP